MAAPHSPPQLRPQASWPGPCAAAPPRFSAPPSGAGPRDAPAIALTFDDGPSEGTPRILEILARHRVPATFFQCGRNVDRLPAVAREVRRAGHEIGNHSYTHPLFCFRSPAFMENDLRRAQESIERAYR